MRDERDGRGQDQRADGLHEGFDAGATNDRRLRSDISDAGDRRIKELFAASRHEHSQVVPGFHETLHASHPARRRLVRPVFVTAAAATCAGAALAVVLWSGTVPSPLAPQKAPAFVVAPMGTTPGVQAASGWQGNGHSNQGLQPRAAFHSIGPAPAGTGTMPGGFLDPGTMVVQGAARGRAFKAAVDGVSNVDPLTGTFMSNINPDAIDDVEIVTTGASADYGGAIGGYAMVAGNKPVDVAQAPPRARVFNFDEANPQANTEAYTHIQENEFLAARENPLSTFSIDVDTASYANVRRFLEGGALPPAAAVRLEELINYFPYDDPPPNGEAPFATRVEIAGCPWNMNHRLARIALKAQDLSRHGRPPSNLVFLIDVSGSMDEGAKLPLVISSLKQLVAELDGRDSVGIVVYAGASGLVLPPTSGADQAVISAALDRLRAGGGTNGGEGLLLAYRTARKGFIPGGTNRVILATDGDFNLGVTDRTELLDMISRESGGGIFLTVLGFGMGNYKDDFLETLADKGNGNHAYIDSPREARKVLVEGMGGTLITVAKDVKIQVEFNPARVASYRLIGYENRLLAKEDFNDDTKDAGEIGAGHSVTALYELVPAGSSETTRTVDPLKYQKAPAPPAAPSAADESVIASDETLTVKLRYKNPEGKESKLLEVPVVDSGLSVRAASPDFKFAASVAMFGMNLRNSKFRGEATFEDAQKLAAEGIGRDPGGYRADFQRLVGVAANLRRGTPAVTPTTP